MKYNINIENDSLEESQNKEICQLFNKMLSELGPEELVKISKKIKKNPKIIKRIKLIGKFL